MSDSRTGLQRAQRARVVGGSLLALEGAASCALTLFLVLVGVGLTQRGLSVTSYCWLAVAIGGSIALAALGTAAAAGSRTATLAGACIGLILAAGTTAALLVADLRTDPHPARTWVGVLLLVAPGLLWFSHRSSRVTGSVSEPPAATWKPPQ